MIKPMWKTEIGTYMLLTEAPLEAKAFIIFYINILWPDTARIQFNSYGPGGANENAGKEVYPWNAPFDLCDNMEDVRRFLRWFPLSLFPYGNANSIKTKKFAGRWIAALDLLVNDCFKNPKLIINKSAWGLGWYTRWMTTREGREETIDMQKDVADNNIKGYYYIIIVFIFVIIEIKIIK